jgi:c(7)-type cytochrome triheme protein
VKRGLVFVVTALMFFPAHYEASADDLGDYGTIFFQRKIPGADDIPPARFPHWVHRMNFKCYVCHEGIFQMKAGADDVTMDDVRSGKFCGVCHNGKTAFQVTFETCPRCHRT